MPAFVVVGLFLLPLLPPPPPSPVIIEVNERSVHDFVLFTFHTNEMRKSSSIISRACFFTCQNGTLHAHTNGAIAHTQHTSERACAAMVLVYVYDMYSIVRGFSLMQVNAIITQFHRAACISVSVSSLPPDLLLSLSECV